MAKITDIPADLQRHAKNVPADILAKLSQAELRSRCEAAEEHHKTARKTGDQEHSRYLYIHARKMLKAIPAVEYIHELRRLGSLMQGAGNREVWQAHRDRRLELEDENAYPAGLVLAVDRALLGQASTPEAQEIAAHHGR